MGALDKQGLNSMQVTAQHHTAFQRSPATQLTECQAIFLFSHISEQGRREWKKLNGKKNLDSPKILHI